MFNRLDYTKSWQEKHAKTPQDNGPSSTDGRPRKMDLASRYRDNGRTGFDNQVYAQELQQFPSRQGSFSIPRPDAQWRSQDYRPFAEIGKGRTTGSEVSYALSDQRRNLYTDGQNSAWGQAQPDPNYGRGGQQRIPQYKESPYDARSTPNTQHLESQGDNLYRHNNYYDDFPNRENSPYQYDRQFSPDEQPGQPQERNRNNYTNVKYNKRENNYSSNFPQSNKRPGYQDNFNNFYNEPEEPPSWIKRISKTMEADKDSDADNTASLNPETSSCSKTAYFTTRLFTMFVILWDLGNDWVITASGPSPFVDYSDSSEPLVCTLNNGTLETFTFNSSTFDDGICSSVVEIWTAISVFALLGSVFTVCQTLNILLEMLNICRRRKVFQIIDNQKEVCLVIFLEQLPQLALLTVLLFVCKCTSSSIPNLHAIVLSTFISATLGPTMRFCTAFEGFVSEKGCCKQWWRCCCCADIVPNGSDMKCWHTLDTPCLPFCCTLRCRKCTFSIVPWCADLVKMFSCFCYCCDDKDTQYGIKLINMFGMFLLWLALALQIVISVTM